MSGKSNMPNYQENQNEPGWQYDSGQYGGNLYGQPDSYNQPDLYCRQNSYGQQNFDGGQYEYNPNNPQQGMYDVPQYAPYPAVGDGMLPSQGQQKKGKKRKLWIVFIVLAAAAGVLLFLLFSGILNSVLYKGQMQLGDKYLSDNNYHQAMASFGRALRLDSGSTEAEDGLREAALALSSEQTSDGQYEKAVVTLEKGLEYIPKDVELTDALADTYTAWVSDLSAKDSPDEVRKILDGAESAGVDEGVIREAEENADKIAADPDYPLEKKLDDLIEEEGVFKAEQSGSVSAETVGMAALSSFLNVENELEDGWLDCRGVLGSSITDLDSDGDDELLVCRTFSVSEGDETANERGFDTYIIGLEVYEKDKGRAVLSSSLTDAEAPGDFFGKLIIPGDASEYEDCDADSADWNEVMRIGPNTCQTKFASVQIISRDDGEPLILVTSNGSIGDLHSYAYAVRYKDGHLVPAFAFNDLNGDAVDFNEDGTFSAFRNYPVLQNKNSDIECLKQFYQDHGITSTKEIVLDNILYVYPGEEYDDGLVCLFSVQLGKENSDGSYDSVTAEVTAAGESPDDSNPD